MDFGLAFSYVFKDNDWLKKIAILSLVGLIPIIGQMVVFGWALNVTKKVMAHDPQPLPDLDFGADLTRGFMGSVISFVYAIPITLVSGLSGILSSATAYSASDSSLATVVALISICAGLFSVLYGIAIALVLPAALTNYLEKDSLSAGFDLGPIFKKVQINLGTYFIVFLGSFVAGLVAGLGIIACVIGVMLTYTYSMAVIGHFYGQAYNVANKAPMVVEIPPAA